MGIRWALGTQMGPGLQPEHSAGIPALRAPPPSRALGWQCHTAAGAGGYGEIVCSPPALSQLHLFLKKKVDQTAVLFLLF